MCNHFSIYKLFFIRKTISPLMERAAVVALFVAGSLQASAQIPGPMRSVYVSSSEQFGLVSSGVRIIDEGVGSFSAPPAAPGALQFTISADELRHPLTAKARRILLKAWNYSKGGDHRRAIATVKEGTARVRSLIPYSHGLLGIEYMQTGNVRDAVTEMKESIEMFPHDAPGHSNLALSLCLTGDLEGAEREAKLALYLEPTLSSAAEIVRIIEEYKARRSAARGPSAGGSAN